MNKTLLLALLVSTIVLAMSGGTAAAQTAQKTSTLLGTVVDEAHLGVGYATVALLDSNRSII